jgi:tetratricopeptide (TPR) repeat protein
VRTALVSGLLVLLVACDDAERKAPPRIVVSVPELIAQARGELAKGHPEKAIPLLNRAVAEHPDVPTLMRLAEAYSAVGNEPAALLAIKQAEEKSGGKDPSFTRARAELYVKMHDATDAITELQSLLAQDLLTDREVRLLAQLLGHAGRLPEAFTTLDHVLARAADDEETKVVEAELLVERHDDVLANKLLDGLVAKNPGLVPARVLRARLLKAAGLPERALAELERVPAEQANAPEVVGPRVELLEGLGRSADAVSLAQHLVDQTPKAAEAIALLAEARLTAGQVEAAQTLVEQALAIDGRCARALTVRGRSLEDQHQLDEAMTEYQAALEADPAYAPALSRRWRVELARDAHGDALATLERLDALHVLAADEKLSLVRLSVEASHHPERSATLVDELLQRDPKNAELLALKAKLGKPARPASTPRAPGIVIIKGGKR